LLVVTPTDLTLLAKQNNGTFPALTARGESQWLLEGIARIDW